MTTIKIFHFLFFESFADSQSCSCFLKSQFSLVSRIRFYELALAFTSERVEKGGTCHSRVHSLPGQGCRDSQVPRFNVDLHVVDHQFADTQVVHRQIIDISKPCIHLRHTNSNFETTFCRHGILCLTTLY
jgi:hypothetical protein